MSLYRKYRPQTLAEVIGQPHITETLQCAVEQDRIAHAYLFAGTRGTGKTSIARILAKILLIRHIEDAAKKEHILTSLRNGTMVDLLEIDAASNRGIDDIRDIIEKIQFPPIMGNAKVYIIDEVHMLTKEAFNALLKTLEEPPSHAYFLLATTELWKIPDTIQSRCQRFAFNKLKEEDIISQLSHIATQEELSCDETALRAIAVHANGGMRDAITLLDQLRSEKHITEDMVQKRLGTGEHTDAQHMVDILDTGDSQAIINHMHTMEQAARPMEHLLRDVLTVLRKQLHAETEQGKDSHTTLQRIGTLLSTLRAVRTSPLPTLTVETAFLSLCKAQVHTSPLTAPVQPAQKQRKQAQQAAPIQQSSICSLAEIQKHWEHIVHKISPASVRMSLKNGQLTSLKNNVLTITFSSAFHKEKSSSVEAVHTLQTLLQNGLSHPIQVQCILQETATPDKEAVVDLVEAATEVF
ncbi:DNA polymerase III, subunit gamma and tau [Candidatus Peregrinibacteria bacterium CG10_big_fil_rev_8_21_14_0_10_49_16]|nr:MAG: DNA polymerase III, subunit gamma and tau [Candidatus Peregrinibacteria bacterium CG22_combo_CG10-13_8_21_14_all_49_11]PIR51981.1 MAG: DNA polymerase III, subunit gamma and tau [Candidatus Peregrinibacteria bacterium CG10_big_fil_rev_8_21_14_0_10_49_16]